MRFFIVIATISVIMLSILAAQVFFLANDRPAPALWLLILQCAVVGTFIVKSRQIERWTER